MCTSTRGCGVEGDGIEDRGSRQVLTMSTVSCVPEESFSGLLAIARESVGQLLPKRDPTKQPLAISSRQEDLDIGSGKSKSSMLRCCDATPFNEAPHWYSECYAPATLLLRSPWQAAAESWWSHHSSNDNDAMTQIAGCTGCSAEDGMPCSLANAEPVGRLSRSQAADQQSSTSSSRAAPGQREAV